MTEELVITCVGDLVEDVIVYAPEGVRVGTDSPARVERHRGGSAANVAVAAALLGGTARYVGNVGHDLLGDHLLAQLSTAGVEIAVTRSGRSGSIVAVVDGNAERSFLTDRGSAGDLTSAPDGWLLHTAVVHVPMYSLLADPMRATTLEMLDGARGHNVSISLDASSTGAIADAGVGAARDLIERIAPDYLFCNHDEAELLRITQPDRLATVTIIKQGAKATVVYSDAGVDTYPVAPVDDVVDTTGAGDAFAAGFLVTKFQRAGSQAAAVATAHLLAARTIIAHGATPRF